MARKKKTSENENSLMNIESSNYSNTYGTNEEIDNETDVLKKIHAAINNWQSYYKENITLRKEDRRMVYVDQWDANDIGELKRLGKSTIEFNKIYDIVRKVCAEQRDNKISLRAKSIYGKANQKEIDIMQGAVIKIIKDSDAEAIFDRSFEDAASGGFSAWRIYTDYENKRSFNQIPKIKTVAHPEKCFFDVSAQDENKQDGDLCGYENWLSKDQFNNMYPDMGDPESFQMGFEAGTYEFQWITKEAICIVEYFEKEWFTEEIYELANGEIVTEKEYNDLKDEIESLSILDQLPYKIIKKRISHDYKIMAYKAIKGKIIEKQEWPCRFLPLVFWTANSQIIDGKEKTISLVRYAKDAQRFHNLVKVEIFQSIQYMRREQFLATPRNVEGKETIWTNPSIQVGALLYNFDEQAGPPIQIAPPQIANSLLEQARSSELDIQSIMGFFEANRGAQGNELSGKAIEARRKTGNLSSTVLYDNYNKAIELTGKIISSLLSRVLDTERKIQILNKENRIEEVMINQKDIEGNPITDLTKDEFDIEIDAAPSFELQRTQSLEALFNLASLYPESKNMFADLIAKNMDIDCQATLVDRMKMLVPPEVVAKENGQPPPPPQPNPMQEMMQAQLQFQQKEIELKESQQEINMMKLNLERSLLEERAKTAVLKNMTDSRKAEMEHEASLISSASKIASSRASEMKMQRDMAKDIYSRS